jgi:hypothetical protein
MSPAAGLSGKEPLVRSVTSMLRFLRFGSTALLLLVAAAPASAQWTQVTEIPVTPVFSVMAKGDTIVAGADTAVYVSINGGQSWNRSARPVAGVAAIPALWIRNGRLFIGTFGQGVFVSDDLGTSWQAFNQGLVGGFLDTQLHLDDLVARGDSLYAATSGAGVYVRSFTGGTWQPFGAEFEPNQASNVNSISLGGVRLLATGGANGQVFRRDPGEPDWTVSNLDNAGLHPGLEAQTATWNGFGWVVGTNLGVFRSTTGQEPWTRFDPAVGTIRLITFANQGRHLFGAFVTNLVAVMQESSDDGATWGNRETLPGVFVARLAVSGNVLYAARADGLWRHAIGTASVLPGGGASGVRFALAGPQPFGEQARLRFELPAAGVASIEVFDAQGRLATGRLGGWWSAGPHEVTIDAQGMSAGVYTARLTAGSRQEVVRLVHLR